MKWWWVLVVMFSPWAAADLYRCTDDRGRFQYSDRPCATDSSYELQQPIQTWQLKKPSKGEQALIKQYDAKQGSHKKARRHSQSLSEGCGKFTSTELRNLRVKDKLANGLPAKELLKRYGQPDNRDVKSGGREKWYYNRDRVYRTFSLQNKCLVAWKERWKKAKSKISKYNE